MRLIDADALKKEFSGMYNENYERWIKEVIDNAPTVSNYSAPTVSNYSEGWTDGYNHAIDLIFKELNYLVKNHVLEELRKTVNLKR